MLLVPLVERIHFLVNDDTTWKEFRDVEGALAFVSYVFFVVGTRYLLSGSFRQRRYACAWTRCCVGLPFVMIGGCVANTHCPDRAVLLPKYFSGAGALVAFVVGYSFVANGVILAVILIILGLFSPASHRTISRCGNLEQWFCLGGWTDYIHMADVRWVRVSSFRRWNDEGVRIPRAQELLQSDFIVGGESTGRLIISHVWRTLEHPDPLGHGLRELVDEFARLGVSGDELVFYDYCSLFQDNKQDPDWERYKYKPPEHHPRTYLRTKKEDDSFKKALAKMHLLYTRGFGRVLVMPQAPGDITPYAARGWCFFELMACTISGRIANADNVDVAAVLEETQMPMGSIRFIIEFSRKRFTGNGDASAVHSLYRRMWLERVGLQMGLVFVLAALCMVFHWIHDDPDVSVSHQELALIVQACLFVLILLAAAD